jgi:hypothetical protein
VLTSPTTDSVFLLQIHLDTVTFMLYQTGLRQEQ